MSKQSANDSKQLQVLERWRAAELETAQTLHTKLVRITAEKQSAVDRVVADIGDAQSFIQDQVRMDRPLSAESLRHFSEFAALQSEKLTAAQAAHEASRADSDAAHADVVQRFEQLSVVERLRERRAKEGVQADARMAQKRLDEHALARLAGGSDTQATRSNEE